MLLEEFVCVVLLEGLGEQERVARLPDPTQLRTVTTERLLGPGATERARDRADCVAYEFMVLRRECARDDWPFERLACPSVRVYTIHHALNLAAVLFLCVREAGLLRELLHLAGSSRVVSTKLCDRAVSAHLEALIRGEWCNANRARVTVRVT